MITFSKHFIIPCNLFALYPFEISYLDFHRKGTDVGDHPPITPMKSASESELSGDSWRIYDYITRHFIATVSVSLKCF